MLRATMSGVWVALSLPNHVPRRSSKSVRYDQGREHLLPNLAEPTYSIHLPPYG